VFDGDVKPYSLTHSLTHSHDLNFTSWSILIGQVSLPYIRQILTQPFNFNGNPFPSYYM